MFGSGLPSKRGVTLYTSLPPRLERFFAGRDIGAAYQRACIASWKQLGFDVVSLNSRSEIDVLAEADYDVTFEEVASKRPRIVDFVRVIQNSGRPVAGIINADCLLISNDNAAALVLEAAAAGIVLMERINLETEDARVTGVSCSGFDFLCFSTEPLHLLKFDDEISIGTPWWDYWFPLAYRQTGAGLFAMAAPILMHLDHPQNWSWQAWLTQGRRMHAALSSCATAAATFPFLAFAQDGQLSEAQAHALATGAFEWLKKSASTLETDDPNVSLLLSFLSGIDKAAKDLTERDASLAAQDSTLLEVRAMLDERDSRLAEQGAILDERASMLAERDARLRAIEASIAWKLTRPMRAVAGSFPFGKKGGKMLR